MQTQPENSVLVHSRE